MHVGCQLARLFCCKAASITGKPLEPQGIRVNPKGCNGCRGTFCGQNTPHYKAHICLPLQDWVDDMSTYLKSIDRNHLVMVASFGYFGASSPASLIAENPTEMVVVQNQDTRLFPVPQICQGEDSSAIASLENIDLSDMHIYPELWAFCDNR